MAYDDDEVKRLRKREADRFSKRQKSDPDVIAERQTRDQMVEELLRIPTEAEFRSEFVRVMKSYGLQVSTQVLENAAMLWKTRH